MVICLIWVTQAYIAQLLRRHHLGVMHRHLCQGEAFLKIFLMKLIIVKHLDFRLFALFDLYFGVRRLQLFILNLDLVKLFIYRLRVLCVINPISQLR